MPDPFEALLSEFTPPMELSTVRNDGTLQFFSVHAPDDGNPKKAGKRLEKDVRKIVKHEGTVTSYYPIANRLVGVGVDRI